MNRSGLLLGMLLLLVWYAWQSRPPLPPKEVPAFFVEGQSGVRVAIGNGQRPPVLRQFDDDISPWAAIELTLGFLPSAGVQIPLADLPLRDGEVLESIVSPQQTPDIRRKWMPARWRLALAIPLHPDRMSEEDWQALPGIGVKLAAAIEADRQRNGDFYELQQLQRVRGIGPKRIQAWEKYFASAPNN